MANLNVYNLKLQGNAAFSANYICFLSIVRHLFLTSRSIQLAPPAIKGFDRSNGLYHFCYSDAIEINVSMLRTFYLANAEGSICLKGVPHLAKLSLWHFLVATTSEVPARLPFDLNYLKWLCLEDIYLNELDVVSFCHAGKRSCLDLIKFMDDLYRVKILCLNCKFLQLLAETPVSSILSTSLDSTKIIELRDVNFMNFDEISIVVCLIRSVLNFHELYIELAITREMSIMEHPELEPLEALRITRKLLQLRVPSTLSARAGGAILKRFPFDLNCVKRLYLDRLHMVEDFSNMTFDHLGEVKLIDFIGPKPEMQFIKLLLAKSPVLENAYRSLRVGYRICNNQNADRADKI
ncbi:hypothetical protein HAX54_019693 [Datura stramonium]|uniref:FBD domain-containing protein n=1 Tax=Datura stramonium TaxID=4076 RepID=A0ABS8UPL8_DATST|nr:hypothetical protein [Datura stramonium]